MNPWRFFRRWRRGDADFAAEIAAHLALEADRLVAEGRSPEEALYEAQRHFGNITLAAEDFHDRRAIRWLETLPHQIHRAARRLVRSPVFASTAVLTLALGIGITTAVFSVLEGVLLQPLPFASPDRLVDLSHQMVIHGVSQVDQSDATYLYYRRANHSFSGVGVYRTDAVNLGAGGVGDSARAERVEATRASAGVFDLLGVAPLRGRALRAGEDGPGTRVALLSARLWSTRYASDSGILGRVITVDGIPTTVVGIMPARFAFPDEGTALWLPIGIDSTRTKSAAFDYRGIARLRAGVTPAAASRDLAALLPRVPDAFPGRLTAGGISLTHMQPVVRPLLDTVVGGVRRALWVIFGAGACLLFIACANVANLFLARAEERQHEIAVRRALGAGRGVIVTEFLAEGLLLAGTGGALGIGLAWAGLGVLRSLSSSVAIPRLDGVEVDGAVLAAAAGVTLLAALVMSVVPALRSSGAPVAVLVQGGRGATAGRGRHRARRLFVVVQLALALVLVTGAGLMARTFQALRSVRPGFDAARAYALRMVIPVAAYPGTSDAVGLVTRATDQLAALPDIEAAGVISKLPLDAEGRADTALFAESRPRAMGTMPSIHQVTYATPGAFRALGIPLLEGRTFEAPDPSRALLEVVVTHALARRYWDEGQAVGERLRLSSDGPLFTVVGVTGDVRGTGLDQPPDETVFLPLVTAPGPADANGTASDARWAPRNLALVVRSLANPRDVTAEVERTVRTLAPTLPVYALRTMADVVMRSTARTSFTLELLELASLAALAIGAVGLYGVVSYMVSLRTREMAVRVALGAEPGALRWLVLRQAVAVAAVGIVLGVVAALILTRFLSALLFDVAPTDPVTLLGAAILMAAVAVTASWLPARRAAATAPASILRADA